MLDYCPPVGLLPPLVLAGSGAEGSEKILGIWDGFSLIFLVKSMILRLKPQKNSRLRRALPGSSIFEVECKKNCLKTDQNPPNLGLIFWDRRVIAPPCFGGSRNKGGNNPTNRVDSVVVPAVIGGMSSASEHP